MSSNANLWTDQQIEKLTEMRAAGSLLADMMRELGKSKNAICGKIYRLGLPAVELVKEEPAPEPEPAPVDVKPTEPIQPIRGIEIELPPVAEDRLFVHFLEARESDCREIIDYSEDGYALFCGDPKKPGSSYCPMHHGINTQLPREFTRTKEMTNG